MSENSHEPALDPSQWIDAYGDYLYRYAHSRLRDRNAAEEVLQETLVAGFRHQDQFEGTGPQRAWLLAILKRKVIDYVRDRAKQIGTNVDEEDAELDNMLFDESDFWRQDAHKWGAAPARQIEFEELQQILRECLSHVPTNQADVFVLSVMEGLSSEEICKALEISSSNLWVRLHRARLHLANCVGAQWDPAE